MAETELSKQVKNLVDKMSLSELMTLEKELERQKAKHGRLSKIAKEFQKRINTWNKRMGTAFSLEDVLSSNIIRPRKAGRSLAKYRNPNNQTETWTGLGRKPTWLKKAIADGTKLEELAIKKKDDEQPPPQEEGPPP